MPNVGPIEGWRIATVARLPILPSASPRPTVVVVLPSPSGVGVIAETTTYFAFGFERSSSIASSLILATSCPYGSSKWAPMPILAAISGIGRSRARRAMSRSLGNVTAIPLLLAQSRQHLPAPSLRRLDLVEREYVQAGDAPVRLRDVGGQRVHKAARVVPARAEHARQPAPVTAQKSGGLAD